MDHSPVNFSLGSSPLARGLRGVVLIVGPLAGIIPARAGFTRAAVGREKRARIIPARAGFTAMTTQ